MYIFSSGSCAFCSKQFVSYDIKGPVIIYCLGAEDFSGDHLIFRRTKGGITENFGRIQRGGTQICLENEDMGAGS